MKAVLKSYDEGDFEFFDLKNDLYYQLFYGAVIMNFAIRELEYLLECLNFHYSEHSDEKSKYMST